MEVGDMCKHILALTDTALLLTWSWGINEIIHSDVVL